jgi:hypothetical protein
MAIGNQPIRLAGDAQARSFMLWAKIGHGKNDSFATRHPLICHCIDVGKSAALLWTNVLRESVKGRLAAALGVGGDTPSAGRWVAFWAAAHDLRAFWVQTGMGILRILPTSLRIP